MSLDDYDAEIEKMMRSINKETFMSAGEARKLSQEMSNQLDDELIRKLNDCILKAIKEGSCYCWYYGYLNENLRDALRKRGYKVLNISNQLDGNIFEISW